MAIDLEEYAGEKSDHVAFLNSFARSWIYWRKGRMIESPGAWRVGDNLASRQLDVATAEPNHYSLFVTSGYSFSDKEMPASSPTVYGKYWFMK